MTSLMKIYIKRTEMYQNQHFIANRFKFIGRISDIKFIQRLDNNRRQYNSAIVTFDHWYDTPQAKTFLQELGETRFGEYKFNYRDNNGVERFWYVKEQTDDQERIMGISNSLNNPENKDSNEDTWIKIQLLYYKNRNELLEKESETLRHENVILRLQSDCCNQKVEQMEDEVQNIKKELKNKEISNNMLQLELEFYKIRMRKMENEINLLVRDVADRNRIIDYYTNIN